MPSGSGFTLDPVRSVATHSSHAENETTKIIPASTGNRGRSVVSVCRITECRSLAEPTPRHRWIQKELSRRLLLPLVSGLCSTLALVEFDLSNREFEQRR